MTVHAAVEKARVALADAEAALREVRKRRTILCSCGKRHAIGKLALIVTHWYVQPHGCTEGDYWNEGEWRFVCPTTNVQNRLLFDDYVVEYEKRSHVGVAAEPTFKSIYRGLFASSKDVREHSRERGETATFNNYDVDKHRARFELPVAVSRG